MKLLNCKKIIGLPVYDRAGEYYGKIFDLEIDPNHHLVINYFVRPHSLIKKISRQNLIIHYQQVISLNEEKMIIESNFIKQIEPSVAPAI